MKFLDLQGLQKVISKLKEWVEGKLSTKVETITLREYKKKKKTVQHIIGRALSLDTDNQSQENWYWFIDNVAFRTARSGVTSSIMAFFPGTLTHISSNISVLYRFKSGGDNDPYIKIDSSLLVNITSYVEERYCTFVVYGIGSATNNTTMPIGIHLDSYVLTSSLLTLKITIFQTSYKNIQFVSNKYRYAIYPQSEGIKVVKTIRLPKIKIGPNASICQYSDTEIASFFNDDPVRLWYRGIRASGIKLLLKKRHSVKRKVLDPSTGDLVRIRTAPRFTKIRGSFIEGTGGVASNYSKGYYQVYACKDRFIQYIGDIVITAARWKIEDGKRKVEKYKIIETKIKQ